MPSRPLLFLHRLARVHQEDRSYLFFLEIPMPSRPLLFLYRLARVHQEDRSYLFSLEVHAQSTAAVPVPPCSCAPRGPQLAVFPGGPCPVDGCCPCTALLVCTKRTAASCFFLEAHAQSTAAVPAPPCYPSAHPKMCYLSKCTPKNVLSKCTPRTCYPSAHSERAIQVHSILVYYSCTTNLVHLS